jgi:hypothetical protein
VNVKGQNHTKGGFMMRKLDTYFVDKDQAGEFMVVHQDWCPFGGNYWATKKDGFKMEKEAQEYADKLNKNCQ